MRLIFTCKQASHRLSQEDYEKLPPLEKLSLKLHVMICPICGAYNRQIMKFQDMMRTYRDREEKELETDSPEAPHLHVQARERIKAALKEATSGPESGE